MVCRLLALSLCALPLSAPAQEFAPGEKLALYACGRCHVVSERNRLGGIGSTPSFAAMRALGDWQDRFDAFWTLAPHPAFTQIEGVTEPFPENRPSPIAPVELTLEQVHAIRDYARSIPAKDLGPALEFDRTVGGSG